MVRWEGGRVRNWSGGPALSSSGGRWYERRVVGTGVGSPDVPECVAKASTVVGVGVGVVSAADVGWLVGAREWDNDGCTVGGGGGPTVGTRVVGSRDGRGVGTGVDCGTGVGRGRGVGSSNAKAGAGVMGLPSKPGVCVRTKCKCSSPSPSLFGCCAVLVRTRSEAHTAHATHAMVVADPNEGPTIVVGVRFRRRRRRRRASAGGDAVGTVGRIGRIGMRREELSSINGALKRQRDGREDAGAQDDCLLSEIPLILANEGRVGTSTNDRDKLDDDHGAPSNKVAIGLLLVASFGFCGRALSVRPPNLADFQAPASTD